jgi:hypothetical protein
MKPASKIIALFILAVAFRAPAPVIQHVYTIDWYKVAGGGDTSTGAVYAVSGTVGQPDAGTMTGGRYGIAGGYWAVFSVVPTPGAPLLTITLTTTNTARVSWPSPSTGWNLQQNNDLSTTNWVSGPAPADSGIIKYIIVNPPSGNRFYRLKH